ncbi:hypothetical protein GCM10010965_11340 [Caldalkalibacillus thermarum]|nr:YfhD family protein [Caldalkalibacillus thermarum]GGK20056.1 hypothetical protein GCM10010965_11340 [Caldalkalibacillus thermarum]
MKRKEQSLVVKAEDIEFSREMADREDLEALKRAEAADKRAQQKK